ncbi:hypothetical protein F2P81_005197 [Scophthalmus maximus]|uniref:Uncharacterized protein n=1 Tax=Scophthalmus maximus TaxID=52904 RepID=A0A6A4T8Y7_SCOMX|nr:hypothetical protein F2P81_005197 [Scophthalmus maximus]
MMKLLLSLTLIWALSSTGEALECYSCTTSACTTSLTCSSETMCITAAIEAPAVPAANSLQCNSCNPLTSQCNNPVQCKGTEDRCFQATVTSGSTTTSVLGCASSNMCDAAANQGQLPFVQSFGNVTGSACCGTNLCNTVSTTTTTSAASDTCRIRLTMIHLLIGLLVFTLY